MHRQSKRWGCPHAATIYSNDPVLTRFSSDKSLDVAAILDKYNVVVQNFRFLEVSGNFKSGEDALPNAPANASQLHANNSAPEMKHA